MCLVLKHFAITPVVFNCNGACCKAVVLLNKSDN